jgi:hypothetical protein
METQRTAVAALAVLCAYLFASDDEQTAPRVAKVTQETSRSTAPDTGPSDSHPTQDCGRRIHIQGDT